MGTQERGPRLVRLAATVRAAQLDDPVIVDAMVIATAEEAQAVLDAPADDPDAKAILDALGRPFLEALAKS